MNLEDVKDIEIVEIDKFNTLKIVVQNHYTKYLPVLNKIYLGGYIKDSLVAVMSLGYGTRPLHTIQKLFPTLTTKDYLENGRMALINELPRNSETIFIKKCMSYIKNHYPEYKLIYTWSDGMLGKPGYVYQAASFLYGGFIWTDIYFTADGERVHPRQTNRIGGRPSLECLKELGWEHYKGKQFRYIKPLIKNTKLKKLLETSTIGWSVDYPKHEDLSWKQFDKESELWIDAPIPKYNSDSLLYNSKIGNLVNKIESQTQIFEYVE